MHGVRLTLLGVVLIMLIGAAEPGRQKPVRDLASGTLPQEATAAPNDVSAQMAPQKVSAQLPVPRRQAAEQSAQLLQLATELKAEVDKTNKDLLSIDVVRKANAIEKLAHEVVTNTKQKGVTN